MQNYLFANAAATLTYKLRTLSFRAILRQDGEKPLEMFRRDTANIILFSVEFFDKEGNSVSNLL